MIATPNPRLWRSGHRIGFLKGMGERFVVSSSSVVHPGGRLYEAG